MFSSTRSRSCTLHFAGDHYKPFALEVCLHSRDLKTLNTMYKYHDHHEVLRFIHSKYQLWALIPDHVIFHVTLNGFSLSHQVSSSCQRKWNTVLDQGEYDQDAYSDRICQLLTHISQPAHQFEEVFKYKTFRKIEFQVELQVVLFEVLLKISNPIKLQHRLNRFIQLVTYLRSLRAAHLLHKRPHTFESRI